MKKSWHKFCYKFWRAVGATAYRIFHLAQWASHKAYLSAGRPKRVPKRPLTAIYKFVQRVRAND